MKNFAPAATFCFAGSSLLAANTAVEKFIIMPAATVNAINFLKPKRIQKPPKLNLMIQYDFSAVKEHLHQYELINYSQSNTRHKMHVNTFSIIISGT